MCFIYPHTIALLFELDDLDIYDVTTVFNVVDSKHKGLWSIHIPWSALAKANMMVVFGGKPGGHEPLMNCRSYKHVHNLQYVYTRKTHFLPAQWSDVKREL